MHIYDSITSVHITYAFNSFNSDEFWYTKDGEERVLDQETLSLPDTMIQLPTCSHFNSKALMLMMEIQPLMNILLQLACVLQWKLI